MSQTRKNIGILTIASILTFILFFWMFSATWVGATGGLLAASFMGTLTLVLGLISYGVQYQRHKAALTSKHKSADTIESHQTRTIEIDLPFDTAFATALDALQTLDAQAIPKTTTGIPSKQSLKIHQANSDIGRIEAGLRAKTFGIQDFYDFSRIQVQLQRLDEQTTGIQIDSAPTSKLETMDLGRNTHYVNSLARTIRLASQELSAEASLVDNIADDDNHEDASGSQRLVGRD